eukprot:3946068-Lingulodinium_polyedra.AAC.1
MVFMRRQVFLKKCVLPAGGAMASGVVDFGFVLQDGGIQSARGLLAHSLCWFSRLVGEEVLRVASTDALDAP